MKAVLPSPHTSVIAPMRARDQCSAAQCREHRPRAEKHDPLRGAEEPELPVEAQRRDEVQDQRGERDVDHPPVQALRQRRRRMREARDQHAENEAGDQQQQRGHRAGSLAMSMSKVRVAFDLAGVVRRDGRADDVHRLPRSENMRSFDPGSPTPAVGSLLSPQAS